LHGAHVGGVTRPTSRQNKFNKWKSKMNQDMINDYITDNLEQIVLDHLDRVKEIISEHENEKQSKEEEE
jgi:hypothetical protein